MIGQVVPPLWQYLAAVTRVGSHAYRFSEERPDGRRCLSVQEMLERGLRRNSRGRWSLPWSTRLSATGVRQAPPDSGPGGEREPKHEGDA